MMKTQAVFASIACVALFACGGQASEGQPVAETSAAAGAKAPAGPPVNVPPGNVDCNTTQDPAQRKACCATYGNKFSYCANSSVNNNACTQQGVPGSWNPWSIDGATVCCPPGAVPTGNTQPQQVCIQPSKIAPGGSNINVPILQASGAWPIITAIIQGHAGLLACYDGWVFFCTVNMKTPLQVKTCIETGWIDCLEGAGVLLN